MREVTGYVRAWEWASGERLMTRMKSPLRSPQSHDAEVGVAYVIRNFNTALAASCIMRDTSAVFAV